MVLLFNPIPKSSAFQLIARFNSTGSLEPTFGSGGSITTFSRAVAIQSDGKIVTIGESGGNFGVTRFNPNGSLDPTFGIGGVVVSQIFTGRLRFDWIQ